MAKGKKLVGVLSDSDILTASVDLRAAPDEPKEFKVTRGTSRADKLTDTVDDQDYLFGAKGNDVLEGSGDTDILSGGRGKDTMDTGTGLGVHIGGNGGDTYKIGDEVLGTGSKIIAFGFNPTQGDVLDLGAGITEAVQDRLEGDLSLITLSEGANLGDIIAELDGVSINGDPNLKAFQNFLATADEDGNIADATTVEIATGDTIIVTGVDVATLVAVLDATVNPA